jgi:hypothetical protein
MVLACCLLLFVIVDLTRVCFGLHTLLSLLYSGGEARDVLIISPHLQTHAHSCYKCLSFYNPLSLFLEYEQINDTIIML